MQNDLTRELIENAREAEKLGINSSSVIKKIEKMGGEDFCHNIFKRNAISENFEKLCKAGRLDLTVEAVAVQKKYSSLFSDEEVNGCFVMLCEYGYFKNL